jgi:hypothetical protein
MNETQTTIDEFIPNEIQQLVFRFFVIFSRFEYALKRSGFVTQDADPAWDAFAKAHRDHFTSEETPELRTACDYFETHPPRRQIFDGGALSWSPPVSRTHEPQLTWLLCMIRRVRNNLFHGGKYPIAHDPDPSRDPTLLNHALVILYASLALDESVSSHFHSPLQ